MWISWIEVAGLAFCPTTARGRAGLPIVQSSLVQCEPTAAQVAQPLPAKGSTCQPRNYQGYLISHCSSHQSSNTFSADTLCPEHNPPIVHALALEMESHGLSSSLSVGAPLRHRGFHGNFNNPKPGTKPRRSKARKLMSQPKCYKSKWI